MVSGVAGKRTTRATWAAGHAGATVKHGHGRVRRVSANAPGSARLPGTNAASSPPCGPDRRPVRPPGNDSGKDSHEAVASISMSKQMGLELPYLGRHVGHPGVRIRAAIVHLPGGRIVELLEYLDEEGADLPDGTESPGNVIHVSGSITRRRPGRGRAGAERFPWSATDRSSSVRARIRALRRRVFEPTTGSRSSYSNPPRDLARS